MEEANIAEDSTLDGAFSTFQVTFRFADFSQACHGGLDM
jgi:hypothetical protein